MISLAAFLIGVALLSIHVEGQGDGLTARTQQGNVVGTLVSPTVRQWLGVPYATAERWEAPRNPPLRKSPFRAVNFGDSCVQSLTPASLEFLSLAGLGDQRVNESEDCLTVNIWSPAIGRKQGTAVMLWIYGGGFQFGTSDTAYYNGQNIVQDNDDVVVITFNYRTNIFGQPNSPQLLSPTRSQNFGLLDIDAVVKWVHSNVASFGGNPDRVILFGQSAGSGAADIYTYAHPKDGIIKGIIEQSGGVSGLRSSSPTLETFNGALWNNVSVVVGCGNITNPAQLACMKAVPFRTLEDAVLKTGASFQPLVDDITFLANTTDLSTAGDFLRVPLLIGSTAQEGDIFVVAAEQLSIGSTLPIATQELSDAITSVLFTCPAGKTARDRTKAGVPTWRYQYHGVFPDISSTADLRAYHASEIPIVFGTYNSSNIPAPPTANEIGLSKYVQEAWVAFARDPVHGLTRYGWPKYNPYTKSLAQLGNSLNKTGVAFVRGGDTDASCGVTNALFDVVIQLLTSAGQWFG